MIDGRYKPITITPNFYQLGTQDFPVYLSMGEDGMIIEGVPGHFSAYRKSDKRLGIAPERIKYLALTHTHPDHIGAVPHLKKLWPHLKVMGSAGAAKALKRLSEKPEALKEFLVARPCHLHDSTPKRGDFRTSEGNLTITFSMSTMFWRKAKISNSARISFGRYIILPVIHHVTSP